MQEAFLSIPREQLSPPLRERIGSLAGGDAIVLLREGGGWSAHDHAEALCTLLGDENPDVRGEAARELEGIPAAALQTIVGFEGTMPQVLDALARTRKEEELLLAILRHERCYDLTARSIAARYPHPAIHKAIAAQKPRIVRSPPLYRILMAAGLVTNRIATLRPNPRMLPKGVADRLGSRKFRRILAGGGFPLGCGDLLQVLFHLLHDPETEIAERAEETLLSLPVSMLRRMAEALGGFTALDFLVRRKLEGSKALAATPERSHALDPFLEAVVLNPLVSDKTIAFIAAETESPYIIDLLSGHHIRMQRAPAIFQGLLRNRAVSPAVIHKLTEMAPSLAAYHEKYEKRRQQVRRPLSRGGREVSVSSSGEGGGTSGERPRSASGKVELRGGESAGEPLRDPILSIPATVVEAAPSPPLPEEETPAEGDALRSPWIEVPAIRYEQLAPELRGIIHPDAPAQALQRVLDRRIKPLPTARWAAGVVFLAQGEEISPLIRERALERLLEFSLADLEEIVTSLDPLPELLDVVARHPRLTSALCQQLVRHDRVFDATLCTLAYHGREVRLLRENHERLNRSPRLFHLLGESGKETVGFPYHNLPPALQARFPKGASLRQKRMAAAGAFPAPPKELIRLLFHLSFDPEEEVWQSALETLESLPTKLWAQFLSDRGANVQIIDFYVHHQIEGGIEDEEMLPLVLNNPATPERITSFLAATLRSPFLLELLVGNTGLFERAPMTFWGLLHNPAAGEAQIGRLAERSANFQEMRERFRKLTAATGAARREVGDLTGSRQMFASTASLEDIPYLDTLLSELIPIGFTTLSENLRRILGPQTPLSIKEEIYLGERALHLSDLYEALYFLLFDEDPQVRRGAYQALSEFSEEVVRDLATRESTPPQLIDFFARNEFYRQNPDWPVLCEAIVRNERIFSRTLLFILTHSKGEESGPVIGAILENRARVAGQPWIWQALWRHPDLGEGERETLAALRPPYSALSKSVRERFPEDAPLPARLAAARGLLPLPGNEMVRLTFHLAFDPEERVHRTALKSFAELPYALLRPAVEGSRDPSFLEAVARFHLERTKRTPLPNEARNDWLALFEAILLNPNTNDSTLAWIAFEVEDPYLIEILGNNLVRINEAPAIFEGLLRNRLTPRAMLAKIGDFSPHLREIYDRVQAEISEASAFADLEMPEEDLLAMAEEELEEMAQSFDFDEDLVEEIEEEVSSEQKGSMLQRILRMNMRERRMLAYKGNREARTILMKTYNRMLQNFVLMNPQITIDEIVRYANDRMMSEDVIRTITLNDAWTKNYKVKLALLFNPKTPLTFAVRHLETLKLKDLTALAQSRTVSPMIAAMARRLYKIRTGDVG